MFLDRGAPMFKGERRRPAGGMNSTSWRKMCKDIGLWKDLAKATVIFEEVTRGQRAMDFELFHTAMVVAAERKRVTAADMMGFVQHYATTYSQAGGDDSSVNSMGSGGSLSSMGSMSSMSSITSGKIRRIKKGRKKKRSAKKGGGMSGSAVSSSIAASFSEEGKTHHGGHGFHDHHHHHHRHAPHKGIATTSILEETKDSREGMSSPEMPGSSPKPFISPFGSGGGGMMDASFEESHAQAQAQAQAKQPAAAHRQGQGQGNGPPVGPTGGAVNPTKPSLRSFAKVNDAKGEYDKRILSTLEAINSSLLNREEMSEEELEATGFSWEVKEWLNVKVQEDPSTWGWAADGAWRGYLSFLVPPHPISSLSAAHFHTLI